MTAHTPALYALKRLHAELSGKAIANKLQGERLADDVRHVEAVIKMLEPGFNIGTIAPKRRNKPSLYFKKGKCFVHVLAVLRAAPEPMTIQEIIVAMLRAWNAEPTRDATRTLFGAVNGCLKNHVGKGVERLGDGRPYRWRLMP